MSRQRVAITGASGLIGGALSSFLVARGDEVLHLVRREPRTAAEIGWDPARGQLDPSALKGVTCVVHLAGVGVGDHRWTPDYKHQILASRVDGTRTVATALTQLKAPVSLVSASGVDYYGSDRGEEVLTEDSTCGAGFLADVVRGWESATHAAEDAGIRVVHARTGIVLSRHGGALQRILPLARLGLTGPLGSGQQWWSWITLADEVRALARLVDDQGIRGAVNLVSPHPARQTDVMKALAARLHRPSLLPAPAFALKAYLGEFSETILGSKRILPDVLTGARFAWEHATLDEAMAWTVAGSPQT